MKSRLPVFYLITIYALLYIPLMVLVVYSFNNARYSMQWHGLSLQWYRVLFHDRALWEALWHSVFLGLTAAAIAASIGFLSCIQLFILQKRKNRGLMSLLLLLIIVPDIVLGVSLLIFFNYSGIPLGFFSLLIAHVTFLLPFVILTLSARMRSFDANIYFSALDLGASKARALTKVLLPILWPAVLSAFLLCFTLSFDDVIISYFVSGPDYEILPLLIYSLVRTGITPELNALCALTFIISMLLVSLSYSLSRKNR